MKTHEECAFCDVLERAKIHKGEFYVDLNGKIRHKTLCDKRGYPACPFVVALHDMGMTNVSNSDVAAVGRTLGYPDKSLDRVMNGADYMSSTDREKLEAACL